MKKGNTGRAKVFLTATAVVAFIALLQSASNWQMHMSWNVYTCQMSINRDKQHTSTDCEQTAAR